MANLVYNYFKKAVLQGSFNLAGSPTLKFMLVGSGYAPDCDTHVYRSSVTNEIAGSGYTAGGFVLSSPLISTNNTDNTGVLDASDISIQNITFGTDAQAAVIYGSSGLGIASDPLVAYIDFVTGQAVTAGTFQITWASGGILALS
jgi:hypothetical protein